MSAYFRPIVQTGPARPEDAVSLAGGWAWFREIEVMERGRPPRVMPANDLPEPIRAALVAPRAAFAGLALDRPCLMGILNVTPDSFSDGGQHAGADAATAHAARLVEEGASIVDIGGESTRPGAAELDQSEEIERVAPVVAAVAALHPNAAVSLDTRKSAVARAGLDAGARIVNDVSGLRHDPELANVVAEAGAYLVLMHSIGTPETMQALAADAYEDVLLDVYDALEAAVSQAEAAGVPRQRIAVDPGIGFGKTDHANLALLSRVSLFHALGCPVLVGVSRKGLVGRLTGEAEAARRGPGSAGIGLWAISQGVQILRIHDMEMHRQALAGWRACAMAPG